MKRFLCVVFASLLVATAFPQGGKGSAYLYSITPNLITEDMEGSLDFYVNTLGFAPVMQWPEEGEPTWVAMRFGGAGLSLQLKSEIEKEFPELKNASVGGTVGFYVLMSNLDDYYAAIKDEVEVIAEPKDQFYGMREFTIFDNNGYVFVFAENLEGESNRVVHFEIYADEPERAIKFYETTFGWDFMKWEGSTMEYWLVMTGDPSTPGIDGGLMKFPSEEKGEGHAAYVCTIDVADLDAKMAEVKAAGGVVVVEKMTVPGVGYMAYALDTEGNMFGMMEMDQTAK